jgi:hypothetical protein
VPTAATALILGTLATGCASRTSPESLPPQTVTRATPEPPPPSEPPVAAPVKDSTVVVIDPGDPDAGSERSLGEASRAERERRQAAGKPAIVITDKNLAEYATGQLTTAEPGPAAGPVAPTAAPANAERGEEYWRGRGMEIRRRWRDAVDRVSELEAEAARLRNRFYAEDDPYVRDGQVKPQWDRALQRLEENRAAAATAEEDLEQFLEEGQRAGALQGWLEEGADLEPPPAAPEPRSAAEPGEPDVIEPVAEEPPR